MLREAVKAEVQREPLPDLLGILGKVLALSPRIRVRVFSKLVGDDFLPRPPRYPKALDVGCGAGDRIIELKRAGWQIEGVDMDEVAVDVATRASGQKVWHGDFRKLDLPHGVYGLVLLHHSFEHFDNPKDVLKKVTNLLAPQGRAIIVYPNPDALGAKIFGADWYPWEIPRHLVLPTAGSIIKAAKDLDLRVIRLKFSLGEAAIWFAYSRRYRSGGEIKISDPSVNIWDRILVTIEKLLLLLKFRVGEEVTFVLQKR